MSRRVGAWGRPQDAERAFADVSRDEMEGWSGFNVSRAAT